jgi:hypothetical protein
MVKKMGHDRVAGSSLLAKPNLQRDDVGQFQREFQDQIRRDGQPQADGRKSPFARTEVLFSSAAAFPSSDSWCCRRLQALSRVD